MMQTNHGRSSTNASNCSPWWRKEVFRHTSGSHRRPWTLFMCSQNRNAQLQMLAHCTSLSQCSSGHRSQLCERRCNALLGWQECTKPRNCLGNWRWMWDSSRVVADHNTHLRLSSCSQKFQRTSKLEGGKEIWGYQRERVTYGTNSVKRYTICRPNVSRTTRAIMATSPR